jgi:alkyldihydroxyacetonephosphate synthase
MPASTEDGWAGWGEPARAVPLPDSMHALLRALEARPGPGRVALADAVLAAPRLPAPAERALVAAVGAAHVHTDDASRARHSAGKSTPDLVRQRAGQAPHPPDAVVRPGSHDEVLAVLRACTGHRVAVVPFGGGTSVVGGLAVASRPSIALDLGRLDRLLAVDPVARIATLQAGVRAPDADRLLGRYGYTLGHLPQSYEYATIGGFAATRSAGQASAGYGRFDDMVVGLTVATPAGSLDLGRAPSSAAGPDLRQLFLGSEGTLGVVTSVRVRVRPIPVHQRFEGWRFPSFEAGTAAVRRLAQDGPLPAVLRLSDEYETALTAPGVDGCLLVVGYGSDRPDAAEALREAGGAPLGPEPGAAWAAGRFAAPYLRDALLDAGVFVEVVETAAFWSRLPPLYAATRNALLDALGPELALVGCHISHVYETGASLYYTVLFRSGEDALCRWAAAKARAGDAILAGGGTISHHHGVGTDHRDGYVREVGPLAVELLRAVKSTVDPAGILNPGVLLP